MHELIIANKNYSSWSMRPWVLLRELGIPFRETLLRFDQGGFRKHSPTGRVPLLVDGNTRVWDSLAITEYLAERHAGVWPTDSTARTWARSAAAEMHSGFSAIRNDCSMSVGVRIRLHQIRPALQADLDRLAELWIDGLTRHGGPFLAGPAFTAVDAFYAPIATRVQTYGLPLPEQAAGYVNRLLGLKSVSEWIAAGLSETFRDASHEEEMLGVGTLLSDLRASPAA